MVYFDVPKEKWQELLGIKDEDIPETLVIEGHLAYPEIFSTRGKKLEDAKPAWMPNLMIGKYKGKTVGYGVCFGGPIASQFAHIYCKLGTKKIVLIGECGGIKKTIELGDIIVSEEVLSLDGVSSLYMQPKNHMLFDPHLRDEVEAKLKERGMRYRIGKTGSYYDILLERRIDVEELAMSGFIGLDMEAAAVCAVANHFKVPSIAMFVVGDNHAIGKDMFYKQTEVEKEAVKDGMEKILEIALEI